MQESLEEAIKNIEETFRKSLNCILSGKKLIKKQGKFAKKKKGCCDLNASSCFIPAVFMELIFNWQKPTE